MSETNVHITKQDLRDIRWAPVGAGFHGDYRLGPRALFIQTLTANESTQQFRRPLLAGEPTLSEVRKQGSGLLLYQTEDGRTRLEVRLDGETIWLAQAQMAELFQTSKQNISLHIQNVFKEGELSEEAVVKEYLTTSLRRQILSHQTLQPRYDRLGRLPRKIPQRHAIPHLGHAAAPGIHREGLHDGRRAA